MANKQKNPLCPTTKWGEIRRIRCVQVGAEYLIVNLIKSICGSNSVVEFHVANVAVAGSNPVSRSKDAGFCLTETRCYSMSY
jgi:hypothetical protein